MATRILMHWGVTSYTGWGVYGLNLALQWAGDPDIELICPTPFSADRLTLDAVRRRALEPFFTATTEFQQQLAPYAGKPLRFDAVMLAGIGPDFHLQPSAHRVQLVGREVVGVTFFESAQFAADTIEKARRFPLIVTGSTWCEQVLRAYGLTNVRTVLQGVDPTLFRPGPRLGALRDRFLVFSGGKMERRKGQDLVVAAFRRFAERRPDALLVASWHSPWPKFAQTLDASGLAAPVMFEAQGGLDLPGWIRANGIPAQNFLDAGATPNAVMPQLLREMDVGLFPNRAEGGTNLVAMECMACGVPAILSANTGHLDLIEEDNAFVLTRQGELTGVEAGLPGLAGWGESDVDEIVEQLERAYADRDEARRRGQRGAETLSRLSWSRTAAQMKEIALSF